jgi:phage terminase large subunit-like protein
VYNGKATVTRRHAWVFAIDAATTNDTFGILGLTKHYNKATNEYIFVPRYARKWTPEPGRKLDFLEPETEIRRLAKELNVVCFCYDEYQMHDMATRLRRDSVAWFKAFPQGKDRLIADKMLYDKIIGRQIQHDGSLHDLRDHLTNANAETLGSGDNRLRIVKRNENMKIDLAVCLSMAIYTAAYLNI